MTAAHQAAEYVDAYIAAAVGAVGVAWIPETSSERDGRVREPKQEAAQAADPRMDATHAGVQIAPLQLPRVYEK